MLRKHKRKILFLGIISVVLMYWVYSNVHLTLVSYLERKGVGEKIQVITQQEIGPDTWLIIYTINGDKNNIIYSSAYEKNFLSFRQLGYGSMFDTDLEHEEANGKQGVYHYTPFESSVGPQWVYLGVIWDDRVEKAVHCGNEMNFIHGASPIPSICWYVGKSEMEDTKVDTLPVLS